MHWVELGGALAMAVAISAADTALAAEEEKSFPKKAAVTMLGYDPESVPTDQCASRAGTAGLLRVGLLPGKSAAERVALHLNVAGLVGAARAVCPDDRDPPPPLPLSEGDAKLDATACRNARDAVRGPIAKTINTYVTDEHTDIATGFVAGVAQALAPIARACDPGADWAALETETQLLTRRAESMAARRQCTVWRKSVYTEFSRAADIAEKKGRAAGMKRLTTQAVLAMAGARHYCGKDDLAEGFEHMQYDLTKTVIEAEPEAK